MNVHFIAILHTCQELESFGMKVKDMPNIYCLTHWPLGDLDAILKLQFSISFYWLVNWRRTSSTDNAPRWMPWDLTDDKSTLVQVMAWCHQTCLSQCWPRSKSTYGVTRPQWVKSMPWLSMPGKSMVNGTSSCGTDRVILEYSSTRA